MGDGPVAGAASVDSLLLRSVRCVCRLAVVSERRAWRVLGEMV